MIEKKGEFLGVSDLVVLFLFLCLLILTSICVQIQDKSETTKISVWTKPLHDAAIADIRALLLSEVRDLPLPLMRNAAVDVAYP